MYIVLQQYSIQGVVWFVFLLWVFPPQFTTVQNPRVYHSTFESSTNVQHKESPNDRI